ncbi:MAG TPA: nucleoid-associated protein, YbaB/EbfC family [Candidatus Omnitrophica bacterium]|nr:MAG: nucleoid-associated protein, YbaB/EbfC family [Omnitrophica WOR_2 bacterium GWA2_53_43]HBO97575.1 nucleoid-associated protein, YbaB/EbfC family [Candidatus Omnitrophota bacterium]HCI44018.1 nucleoid-associated protein, YbaB/EbfC family [Candidatus Omnitrophota bacterium]
MLDKMKQLMEMKRQADVIKRELDAVTVDVQDVRGIRITINGSQNFRSIEIDETLLNAANKARLQAELLRSLNAAIAKSQGVAAQKMKSVLPGFPGF